MAKKRSRKETAKKPRSDRNARGHFTKGNPGGPGRPKGSRNAATLLIEQMLVDDAEALTRALIKRAKAGNASAMQICFARLAPAPKDRAIEITLPAQRSLADLMGAHDMLLQQVASGHLAPAEAETVSKLLENRRRAFEMTELEARLAAIEARLPAPAPLPH
jgi:hypothetical protein